MAKAGIEALRSPTGKRIGRTPHHMSDKGIRYCLWTMCQAGGQANAAIVERR